MLGMPLDDDLTAEIGGDIALLGMADDSLCGAIWRWHEEGMSAPFVAFVAPHGCDTVCTGSGPAP